MSRMNKIKEPKARLKDIEVIEVSTVDRAANGRRFLVTKADGTTDEPNAVPAPAPVPASPGSVPETPSTETPTAPLPVPPVTPEPTPVDKAKWSTKEINDLPDGAFLYVESGGEKDEDGKTKPRSLRHFPYKDAEGNVDLPHLRDALSRIPQSDLPEEIKEKLSAKAEKLLGKEKDEAKAEDADEDDAAEKTKKVAKRGAKMAAERLTRLKAIHSELTKILGELDDVATDINDSPDEQDDETGNATKVAKADEPNPLAGKVVELEKRASESEQTIAKQAAEIERQRVALTKQAEMLAAAHIATSSNSRDPEGDEIGKSSRVVWGRDLNEEFRREDAAQRKLA